MKSVWQLKPSAIQMPHQSFSTARLESFSDGVIAVIITIMVLELKVPHQDGVAGLYALLPIILIYLLSFVFTGIYWINHHSLLSRLRSAENLILYANLSFLFCLSLLPFFTSYVIEKKMDAFAVSLYAISMIASGFSFFLLRVAVYRALRNSGELGREDARARNKHLASLALYLLAVPLAFWQARLAMCLIAFITLIWVVPGLAVSAQPGKPGSE